MMAIKTQEILFNNTVRWLSLHRLKVLKTVLLIAALLWVVNLIHWIYLGGPCIAGNGLACKRLEIGTTDNAYLSHRPVPIFIVCRDRLKDLKETIAAIQTRIATPYHIIIHDQGSTYKPLLEYLSSIGQSEDVTVRFEKQLTESEIVIRNLDDEAVKIDTLNRVGKTIDWYRTQTDFDYYVLTDPDIQLCDETPGDVLLVFQRFLLHYPSATVVGPALRIDDIPATAERDGIVEWEKQFWPQTWERKAWVINENNNNNNNNNNNKIFAVARKIDTTFGMYRGSFPFARHNVGLRVLPPYCARHLGWYPDPEKSEERAYYVKHKQPSVGHWSSKWNE